VDRPTVKAVAVPVVYLLLAAHLHLPREPPVKAGLVEEAGEATVSEGGHGGASRRSDQQLGGGGSSSVHSTQPNKIRTIMFLFFSNRTRARNRPMMFEWNHSSPSPLVLEPNTP
jgi:hypothetical protein